MKDHSNKKDYKPRNRRNDTNSTNAKEMSNQSAIDLIKSLQQILLHSKTMNNEKFLSKTGNSVLRMADKDTRGILLSKKDTGFYVKQVKNIHRMHLREQYFTFEDIQNVLGYKTQMSEGIYEFYTRKRLTGFSASANNFFNTIGMNRDVTVTCVPIVSDESLLSMIVFLRNGDSPMAPFRKEIVELLATMIGKQYAMNNYPYERESLMDTIKSLANAIEEKDEYTKGHSERVSKISEKIAREMNLSKFDIENIEIAALLHDVGKIGISESILRNTGALSESEFSEMKTHPIKTKKILSPLKLLKDNKIIEISYMHHEKYNGTGYPEGKEKEQIPLGARIVMVADSYDAMTSDRPYRQGMSKEYAISELEKHKGQQFDPDVVNAFLRIINKPN